MNTVQIQMSNNEQKIIDFDVCFVCTGSKYAAPIKASSFCSNYAVRQQTFYKIHSDMKRSHSIAIVGGGAVGTELAAEINESYPDKAITIVDAHSNLCHSFPCQTQNYLKEWFNKRNNITLKLETRIKKIIDNKLFFDNCESMQFDLVLKCNGFEPNSQLFDVGKDKFIKVDEWMRAPSQHCNIFAFGDVILQPFINEIKLAHTAEIHAKYLRDLMVHLNEQKNQIFEFEPYHRWLFGATTANKKFDMPLIYTISLGALDGSMGFGHIQLNGFLSILLKLFIETSLCTLYQRSGLFDVASFRIYPIGYRVFSVLWWFNHHLAMAYIRYIDH